MKRLLETFVVYPLLLICILAVQLFGWSDFEETERDEN